MSDQDDVQTAMSDANDAQKSLDQMKMFIPVGYPTAEQSRRGFTGGAIGIHGPLRSVQWLGRVVNWFDTSDGCIGLATDQEMSTLAEWVRSRRVRTIIID